MGFEKVFLNITQNPNTIRPNIGKFKYLKEYPNDKKHYKQNQETSDKVAEKYL